MLLLIWGVVMFAALWMWQKKKFSYFKEFGINHLPTLPFIGNSGKFFLGKQHITTMVDSAYKAFPNDKFIGSFMLTRPSVLIRDPELLRQICVKNFDNFIDHQGFSSQNDVLFSNSLMGLRGQKWREMRSTLSPAFTGSKIRNMVPLIRECNEDLLNVLHQQISESSDKNLDVDTHDLLTRYTTDVVATTAFGLKTNSIKDRNNEFFVMGGKLSNFNLTQMLKMVVAITMPFLTKLIRISILPSDAVKFLKHIILSTIKEREEKQIYRPDMIQLLIEAQKGTLKHEQINDEKDAGFATVEESSVGKKEIKQIWTEDEIVAQAFIFFLAGFDTVSTAIKFLLYELALNPDIQDKLTQEIDEQFEKYGDKIDYEQINQLKYLDMVVSETLRKWPPAATSDRLCVKAYNLGRASDTAIKDYIVKENEGIMFSVWSVQRDAKYFEDPEKFDPERFSDENKHKIQPFTYMPFGIGPRNCIGSRFALVEVKLMVYGLLRRFEVSPAPKTVIPPVLNPKSLSNRIIGGHWLRFKCRD